MHAQTVLTPILLSVSTPPAQPEHHSQARRAAREVSIASAAALRPAISHSLPGHPRKESSEACCSRPMLYQPNAFASSCCCSGITLSRAHAYHNSIFRKAWRSRTAADGVRSCMRPPVALVLISCTQAASSWGPGQQQIWRLYITHLLLPPCALQLQATDTHIHL